MGKYLNEETYQKSKKKISMAAVIVLLIGLLVGGGLITLGVLRQKNVNDKYSEESKEKLQEKLSVEKKKLEAKKQELEDRGIKYNSFVEYTDGEAYDLYLIVNVLNPSHSSCKFDEYKDSELTSKYCSVKNDLENISEGHGKSMESIKYIPFYMFGAFIIISSSMFAGFLFIASRGREIAAFSAQQSVPVGKEVIDEMAPSIGKVAKEVSKGIKQGIKDEEE